MDIYVLHVRRENKREFINFRISDSDRVDSFGEVCVFNKSICHINTAQHVSRGGAAAVSYLCEAGDKRCPI